jgi:hypothetical protein
MPVSRPEGLSGPAPFISMISAPAPRAIQVQHPALTRGTRGSRPWRRTTAVLSTATLSTATLSTATLSTATLSTPKLSTPTLSTPMPGRLKAGQLALNQLIEVRVLARQQLARQQRLRHFLAPVTQPVERVSRKDEVARSIRARGSADAHRAGHQQLLAAQTTCSYSNWQSDRPDMPDVAGSNPAERTRARDGQAAGPS